MAVAGKMKRLRNREGVPRSWVSEEGGKSEGRGIGIMCQTHDALSAEGAGLGQTGRKSSSGERGKRRRQRRQGLKRHLGLAQREKQKPVKEKEKRKGDRPLNGPRAWALLLCHWLFSILFYFISSVRPKFENIIHFFSKFSICYKMNKNIIKILT